VRASPEFLEKVANARLDKPFAGQKLLGLVRRQVRVNTTTSTSLRPH
jgi:hypothetical protein